MMIETITFTERLNTGNYNHLELTATAKVEENETPMTAMLALKTLVHTALTTKAEEVVAPKSDEVEKLEKINETLRKELSATVTEEVKTEAPVEKKIRTRKKVEEVKVEEVKEEVKEEQEVVAKSSAVKYDREIETHRQMLSSYLTKHFPEWKSKPGVKEFSASLVGKDYLDEYGIIVPTFEKLLKDFFA